MNFWLATLLAIGAAVMALAEDSQSAEQLTVRDQKVCESFPHLCQLHSFLEGSLGELDALLTDAGSENGVEKRKSAFVRFGKRKSAFVRFGKRGDSDAAKRKSSYIRFGK